MSLKTRLMQRCFDLARLGSGAVSPNPAVGALLVYDDKIIGEGYYQEDGGPHAEVSAVASVPAAQRHLIPKSTIYVSLEPCNIHGRTPPCVDLILREKIPHVIVASTDLTPGVHGTGLDRLRAAGVKVEEGICRAEGDQIALPRNTFVSKGRPYVMLKYAQTQSGHLAPLPRRSAWLTNAYSKRLVHRWRTQTDAILVGSGTVKTDNPALTSRLAPGPNPLRVVIDRNNSLAADSKIFTNDAQTLIFGNKAAEHGHLSYLKHDFTVDNWLVTLLERLAERRIGHLTVEGGSWLLQQFVAQQRWDEARVFTTPHRWEDGLPAPQLGVPASSTHQLIEDQLTVHFRTR
ncbi:MAG: bifunctional diaminohydroxyphosphoribosylaminopyrimidine deaminase/5-amino-6-(5-phosphoribosylamino)uracil reductase RibD [Bacteroidota bacterium]